jgi:YVTN family beta-propeller protein
MRVRSRSATPGEIASPRIPHRGFAVLLAGIALAAAGCATRGSSEYPANYREYAYVSNSGSNTVTVLDLVNMRQDRVIPVGTTPAVWR